MSEKSDKSPVNVDIGVSAKAEFKTEVPAASTGRLVDALTDAIRPFTEKRGLRADELRLQREDVLIEIAKKAKIRMNLEGEKVNPIPNRILIPMLEKASLTELSDDSLIEAWSNLLSATSRGESANNAIYADILSKLDPVHLKYMDFLYSSNSANSRHPDEFLSYNNTHVLEIISPWISNKRNLDVNKLSDSEWETEANLILEKLDTKGVKILSGFISDRDIGTNIDLQKYPESTIYALDSVMLTETINAGPSTWKGESESTWIRLNKFTYLGFEFYNTCKGNTQ